MPRFLKGTFLIHAVVALVVGAPLPAWEVSVLKKRYFTALVLVTVTLITVVAACDLPPTITFTRPAASPSPLLPLSPGTVAPTATSTPALPTSTPTSPMTPTWEPPVTSATATKIEIIVDNRDPAFSTTGAWFIGNGRQSYKGDCAWAPRGIGSVAYVRPHLPMAGAYEVFAWWCGDPDHDRSQRACIQIHQLEGRIAPHQVYVNLQERAGQWNSLGTYYLHQNGFLTVSSYLDGKVVADAFRFVYRSPEYVVIPPTPLPTSIPDTRHPPTPLEQLTSGDLVARLGLVDRFYESVPVISTEAATFDDCQAFPRDGCGGTRAGWRVQVRYQDMIVSYRVSGDYRFVAIEPPKELASRQVLYLYGRRDTLFFRVDRYPDDTWHVAGADFKGTFAIQLPLDAETLNSLLSFVQAYGSVTFQTPDGIALQLYGLGERVALSEVDRDRLATLATELSATVW